MKNTLKSVDLNLVSSLILSILILIMGVIVLVIPSFGLIDVILYISILFYIYALFSVTLYFIGRKEGDYELLLLSLINIITATFMFIFKSDNAPMILGAGMSIYTILLVINRGIKILSLKKSNSFTWIIKFIITFLIAFLGILTTLNLFKEVTVQTMMFGFYFMSLGFMLAVENLIIIFIKDETFRKFLSKILEEETTLEPVNEIAQNKIEEKAIKVEKTTKKVKENESKVKETITKGVASPVKELKKARRPKKEEVAKTKTETKMVSKPKENKVEASKKEIKKVTSPKKKVVASNVKDGQTVAKKKPGRPKKTETNKKASSK